jgi:hypothetical protein
MELTKGARLRMGARDCGLVRACAITDWRVRARLRVGARAIGYVHARDRRGNGVDLLPSLLFVYLRRCSTYSILTFTLVPSNIFLATDAFIQRLDKLAQVCEVLRILKYVKYR